MPEEQFQEAVMAHLEALQSKADHQTEALDEILQVAGPLDAEAVARARAILQGAKRSATRPNLRLVKPAPPGTRPEDPSS